jgi:methionyl-tRNA formyltransferase
MNIIFFGNTKFSLIGAKIIHKNLGLSQIVTLPDRANKKGHLTPNSLKTFAQEQQIPFLTVDKLDEKTSDYLSSLNADFFVVEDYGLILPKKLLTLPKIACLNIHHSLLPKYRGASPAPFAILAGDEIAGVTVIKMTEKVDAGDIFAQKKYQMKSDETTESLLTELNKFGGELLVKVIKNYARMNPHRQNESQASYTKQFLRQDGFIDLKNPPDQIMLDRMIRAYYPWPTVWTMAKINNRNMRIKLLPEQMLQVEGKNPVSVKDFLNGYPEMRESISKLFPQT